MKRLWKKTVEWATHTKYMKYWLVGGAFIVIMLFFDENNFIKRFSNEHEIRVLQEQVDDFNKKIESNKEKINELRSNDSNLEKFAREEYLMKRPNEDVYIVEEK
jgi:cell division protein FtsB